MIRVYANGYITEDMPLVMAYYLRKKYQRHPKFIERVFRSCTYVYHDEKQK